MYKKTITYIDYNGVERTEDFYFNLNKAELMEMHLVHPEGFENWIKGIIKANDNKTLLAMFKEIITASYGEKDSTGKRFIKSQELTDAFVQSEAFANLYFELLTNTDAATEFVNGIASGLKQLDKTNVVALKES